MPVRLRGFLVTIIFGSLFYMLMYWIAYPESYPFAYMPSRLGSLILVLIPGSIALSGLSELVSGVPFSRLSLAWNALKGWQRGVYGLLVFAAGLLILFGGLYIHQILTL